MISLEACLERIRALEGEVRAWAAVDPQPPSGEGPLSGVPFGVKDVIDTKDLPTAWGSPLYEGRRSGRDAAVVARLRSLGAVLVGKTRTAAFAYFDPPETRNPRAPGLTPGGSSSGSAAAVAAGMIPLALGTQTLGSVLRPASYCGVCGFKPTFGLIPISGVLPFAPSLDTIGLFTATPADMEWVWRRAFGHPGRPPKFAARLRTPCVEAMRRAVDDAVLRLRAAGLRVDELPVPEGFERLTAAARAINDYEGARSHQDRWRAHGDRIGHKLSELVARGLVMPESEYRAALDTVEQMRRACAALFAKHPLLLTPAATGPAPEGLDSTGDPSANAPWTALGVPAISVPMPVEGPPLGLQIAAAWGEDDRLVSAAAWMAQDRV